MSKQGETDGGDQISVGNISNSSGIAIGRNASASVTQTSVTQSVDVEQLAALFAAIYHTIEARPSQPSAPKAEIAQAVKKIETEAAKGDQANTGTVESALRKLARLAPDILDVTASALLNPIAGIALAIRKLAEGIKAQASK